MPNWWDYIHINRNGGDDSEGFSSLQEGLFQIASQTCNILVQVNNTNITYGDSTNITHNQFGDAGPGPSTSSSSTNFGASTSRASASDVHFSPPKKAGTSSLDREQSLDLLSKREKLVKRNSNVFANYKHRLSVSYRIVFYKIR